MKLALLACASVMALTTVPAMAQDSAPQPAAADTPSNATASSGDIVVTATRSSTLLSKTPIAMTAVTGDQLLREGVSNPTQLVDRVPNVAISRGGNGLQITIRGVTSTDLTEKGDPSAAFMLNSIYLARPQATEVSFYDIERVEVLRGPQGTLYGRNTTAGLINVLSARPDFKFGARADASYESYNGVNVTGVVNVPVSDILAFRVAGNINRYDSYIKDTSGSSYSLDPFKDNKSVRLSALFKPSDTISLLVVGDYSKLKGARVNTVPTTNFFTSAAPLTDPTATRAVRAIYDIDGQSSEQLRSSPTAQLWRPYIDDDDKGVMGELNVGLGAFKLTYIGSYRETNRHEHSTISGGLNRATFDGHFWQTSHELRLAYDQGPLKVQVGGYYFKERSGITFFILNPQNLGFPAFATQFGFPQDPTIAVNKSAFGQATYELLPHLHLTAGIRYSSDDKSRVGATVFDTDPAVGIPGNRVRLQINDASRNFSKTTWRAGLDYDSPLGLFYASVATGYKAGGFNDGCLAGPGAPAQCVYTPNQLFYQPETLTAYEAGFKLHTTDNSLRLNGSVFHYDYRGLQVSQVGNFGGCGLCQLTTNAAKAKIDGVELEAYLRPAQPLQFEMGFNWLNARYGQYSPSRVGPGGQAITLDFAGHPLNRSPRVSGRVGATYTIDLGNAGKLVANATLNYSAKYYLTDIGNLIDYIQPAYTKTDLSLTYNAPDDRFYVGVYALNLENNVVLTSAGWGNRGTDGTASFMDPRRFGVRAGVKF